MKTTASQKLACCFMALLLHSFAIHSQTKSPETLLEQYGSRFPAEKLHLQFDKETYLKGETVWFKAYLFADGQPSAVSTTLYADLLDENGKILQHRSMPVLSASADSYFVLPDSAASYTVRAYTTWILNFDTAFLYHKPLQVESPAQQQPSPAATASLQFFPEGGNLVSGLYNYLAFKAVLSNGQPFDIKAAVKNAKGELVDSISSEHDGMGILKFMPETGDTYTAEWYDTKGTLRRTALPAAAPGGLLLHAEQVNTELYYIINSTGVQPGQLTLLASQNQKPVYRAAITMTQNSVSQHFSTAQLETGVLQLTVFDAANRPLAERVVFINNNNYRFSAAVRVKDKGLARRAKNTIEITVSDTSNSNMSLTVYDAGLEQSGYGKTIYSDLLLQGDIRGQVYNAGWYFESNDPAAAHYLDLVMQTQGWRRYNWDNIIAGIQPVISIRDNNYINIYGKAGGDRKDGLAGSIVNLMLQTADSTKNWYSAIVGKDGSFTQNGLIFYDSATVYYKPTDNKTGLTAAIANGYNGLYTEKVNAAVPPLHPVMTGSGNAYTAKFIEEVKRKNPGFEQQSKIMEAVTVKSGGKNGWKNNPLLKMDDKYASGPFKGGATTMSFDLLHDPTVESKMDIYNYLSDKVPLTVSYSNMGKTFTQNPLIFVNESQLDNDFLRTISIDEIAYVKYFDHAYGMAAAADQVRPAVVVYLKKEKDYPKTEGLLSKVRVYGYSPVKEFYQPDYSVPAEKQPAADLRSTLLWRPYIITDKKNNTISLSFYNNDMTKSFKLVLEGMNDDGKLVRIEKIIE